MKSYQLPDGAVTIVPSQLYRDSDSLYKLIIQAAIYDKTPTLWLVATRHDRAYTIISVLCSMLDISEKDFFRDNSMLSPETLKLFHDSLDHLASSSLVIYDTQDITMDNIIQRIETLVARFEPHIIVIDGIDASMELATNLAEKMAVHVILNQ